MFRTNKYNLRMCYYSFELLMEFCLEHHYLVLLRLMNQYMNIQGSLFGRFAAVTARQTALTRANSRACAFTLPVFTGQPQLRTMEDSFCTLRGAGRGLRRRLPWSLTAWSDFLVGFPRTSVAVGHRADCGRGGGREEGAGVLGHAGAGNRWRMARAANRPPSHEIPDC